MTIQGVGRAAAVATLLTLGASSATLSGTGAAGQTAQLRDLMRQKQTYARDILDAVVTNDWITLEQRSLDLLMITEDPAWEALTAPPAAEYSAAFLRAVRDLQAAARDRDQAAAPLAYVSLTLSCVQCHHEVGGTPLAGGSFTVR